ncbi:hypothetical protein RBY4I_1194 [Rhodobacterales bacterium Y4I]|nr:hypothetical protein RBY4I_1194 [Rhodobacterales bacterium Y4I]
MALATLSKFSRSAAEGKGAFVSGCKRTDAVQPLTETASPGTPLIFFRFPA